MSEHAHDTPPVVVREQDTSDASRALNQALGGFERRWLDALDTFHAADASIAARPGLSERQRSDLRADAAARLVDEWHQTIDEVFPSAYSAGGRVWGAGAPALPSDALAKSMAEQRRFATRFAFELTSGQTQAPRRMPVGLRSELYRDAVEGAYQLGAVEASPDGTRITWKLSACRHCGDCPTLAANGPYTRETLPTVPRSGATQCKSRCRCWLELGAAAPSATPPAPAAPPGEVLPRVLTPPLSAPPGLRSPDEAERRILRDLETRMNRARRAAQRAQDAGLEKARDRFIARRADINQRIIDFSRERGIHHVPTWDVGDVVTGRDIRAREVDAITHLRGLDGTTIHRASARAVEAALREAEKNLEAAMSALPPDLDGVPDLDALLRQAGAPESAFGGRLTPVMQSGDGPEWNVQEDVDAGAIGAGRGEQVFNIVGRSSIASARSLLDAVRLLSRTLHVVEIGPLDEDWLNVVTATGWWVRGDGEAVGAFFADLRQTVRRHGLEAAPWQGGGA